MSTTPFRIPTHTIIEDGSRARLPELVRGARAKRVLLVSDPGLAGLGRVDELHTALEAADVAVDVFTEVESNPRTTTVERIAERARETDALVGLGGGSVLDAAKGAAMLATNGGRATDYLGITTFDRAPLPFFALPTTCGTGSEVTWVAVLTDEERATKISLKGEAMFPTAALVDSELLKGAPTSLIATTGMDALTHAVEATTGRPRNPVSDLLAEEAIALLFEHLEAAATTRGEDEHARRATMRASTLAGLAFGNTDVGGVHCLSETLGGLIDVAHGLANAILLAPVMRSHLSAAGDRMAQLDRRLGGTGEAEAFVARLEALGERLAIPPFSSLGIGRERFADIAERSVRNGSNGSNPRPMDATAYVEILEGLV